MIVFVISDPVVIAAAVSSIGSLVAIILTAALGQRNYASTKREHADRKQEIAEVHVLVNDQMDRALRRIAALEETLGIEPGAEIPARPRRRKTD